MPQADPFESPGQQPQRWQHQPTLTQQRSSNRVFLDPRRVSAQTPCTVSGRCFLYPALRALQRKRRRTTSTDADTLGRFFWRRSNRNVCSLSSPIATQAMLSRLRRFRAWPTARLCFCSFSQRVLWLDRCVTSPRQNGLWRHIPRAPSPRWLCVLGVLRRLRSVLPVPLCSCRFHVFVSITPPPVLFLPPAENRHERRNALHSDAVDRSSSAEPCNGSWSVGSVDAESFDVHARRSRKELCVWFAVASCLCRCIVCAVLRVKTVPPPALLLKLHHLHGFKPGHSRSVLAPVFCCHGRTQLRCVYSYWLELFSWNCRQAGDMFSPCAVSLGTWLMAPSSGMAIPESLPRGDVREFRLIFKRRRRFFLIFSFVCIRPKPNKSCLS